MTAQEIIDKLKSHDGYKEAFAYEEWLGIIPDDFEFSDETLAKKIAWDSARNEYHNHPLWGNWKRNSSMSGYDEYVKLKEKYESLENPYSSMVKEWMDFHNFGPIEHVDAYGGEGQGETWWVVKYFPIHNVYLRLDGYYTSYDGANFYDFDLYEVKPQEKTITEYV